MRFLVLLFVLAQCRQPTLLTSSIQQSPNGCGTLKPLPNAHLLQIQCSPNERGFAHGYLLAEQILDWSYFYQFVYNMGGNATYYNLYTNWLTENQFITTDYKEEVSGMLEGMKSAKVNLFIEDLGREFDERDIYAINSYLEGTPSSGIIDNVGNNTQLFNFGRRANPYWRCKDHS
jgi:hypothetical protein